MPPLRRVPPDDPPVSPKSGEEEDFTQPAAKDGVPEGMATLALHPGLLDTVEQRPADVAPAELTPEQLKARRAAIARGDFSALTDAEVMLELKAGNMDAFDVLTLADDPLAIEAGEVALAAWRAVKTCWPSIPTPMPAHRARLDSFATRWGEPSG